MGTHTNCHHIDALERYFGTCPPESRSTKDIVWQWECSACAEVAGLRAELAAAMEAGRWATERARVAEVRNDALQDALVRAEEENVPYRVTRLMDGIDFERLRVTTYRNRALALLQQAQAWRGIANNRLHNFWELYRLRDAAEKSLQTTQARADRLAVLLRQALTYQDAHNDEVFITAVDAALATGGAGVDRSDHV